MIVGFSFRSPDVVKFLIPSTKYVTCIVPEKPIQFEQTMAAFKKQPVGSRKRVYLHKSITSMVMYFNKSMMDHTRDLHIVFDAYSVLSSKPCVKILDIDTKQDATWQLKKTIPGLVEKVLGGLREGVASDDLECLKERTILPEDLITTDRKVDDVEKQNKVKSFLHVLQDIQSKHADKRDMISFWLCAFYAGVLVDKHHVIQTKKISGKWTDGKELNCRVYAEKNDKTARQRMLALCVTKLKADGFELRKSSQAKVLDLIGDPEHVHVMRALWMMDNLNWTPEKASYATGANISLLALIARSLTDKSSIATQYMQHRTYVAGFSMPKKMLTKVKGKQQPETVDTVPEKANTGTCTEDGGKQKKTNVKHVNHGLLTLLELLKQAEIVPETKNMAQCLALSKSPIKVMKANKYIVQGTTKYKVIKGKTLVVRFGGVKYKVKGV